MFAIKPVLVASLETALNKYLALDSDISHFLAPLSGKVIALNVQPFDQTVYLCPAKDTIQVLDVYPGEPDTQLSGTLFALGLMGLSATPMRSIFSGEVTITGDMQTGRRFQELFSKLDIDLEEQLSHVTGDVLAHQIGRFFRSGKDWSEQTLDTFKLNVTEFLQEESRDLPAKPEIDIFFRQVDELRTDFDRLQSKIERLEKLS
jgi:ubiquinone biosynthesis protein UbiJ